MSFHRKLSGLFLYSCSTVLSLFITPGLYAQQLEEIVVTAQRREQSLQEVPVSLEVITGLDIQQQGYTALDDLAAFSPSVEVTADIIRYAVSIRGMGSNGPNLALEQSATTFVDGVHFGRGSMSYGAYLDLERIEILRGPQPVHFGMNATAGAFSLTTKKPGAEWEGDVTAEVGNLGRKKIEGGFGGPITETFGMRLAGKLGRFDGHLTDIVTNEKFPARKDNAGRVFNGRRLKTSRRH
jgi:outer membrane receptor protein involved in Fe transport